MNVRNGNLAPMTNGRAIELAAVPTLSPDNLERTAIEAVAAGCRS